MCLIFCVKALHLKKGRKCKGPFHGAERSPSLWLLFWDHPPSGPVPYSSQDALLPCSHGGLVGEGCCQETGPWHPHSLTSTHLSHLQPGPSVCFGPDEMEWQVDGCCFKATHPEDSNAEKQEQCLTSLKGVQTGFAFFFPRVNINIVVFSSLQVLTGFCHIIAILSGPTRPWSGHRGIGLLPAPSARLGSHQGEQPIFSLFLSEKYLIIIP